MAVVGAGNVIKNNAQSFPVAIETVAIPKHSVPSGRSKLSAIPPVAVRVLPFNDNRKDIDLEGRTKAAFGVPMANIRFAPSPSTLLGQVIISEFKAAGHTLTDSVAAAQITGAVVEFDVHTDTLLLYWEVIGNLAVSLQVPGVRGAQPAAPLDYRVQCLDRTYVWPGEAVIAGVMSKCINDFATKLRDDSRVADALRHAADGRPDLAVIARSSVDQESRGAAAKLRPDEKSYASPAYHWSVVYPRDWTLNDDDRFVKITRGQAVLGIHSYANTAGKSVDEVADAAIQDWERQMKNVNIVRRVSRQRVALAGDLTGIAIEHYIGAGQVGKSRKVIVVVKDRSFVIDAETVLASWTEYERDFNRIIDSFRVPE